MSDMINGAVKGWPKAILRSEGLFLGCVCLWLFWATGTSWWIFAALILVPDISMLGYLISPRFGAAAYNSAHTLVGPTLLAALAMVSNVPYLLSIALIWAAHIEFDRAVGYGLKYPTRFRDTHLGTLGAAQEIGNN